MMNRELHTRQQHPANTRPQQHSILRRSVIPKWACEGEKGRECFFLGHSSYSITYADKVLICSCLKSESKRNFLMIFLKLHKMHFIEY